MGVFFDLVQFFCPKQTKCTEFQCFCLLLPDGGNEMLLLYLLKLAENITWAFAYSEAVTVSFQNF